jgi:hypothetical protein
LKLAFQNRLFKTCWLDNGTAKKKACFGEGWNNETSKEKALELARRKEAGMKQNEVSLALRQKH